MTRTLPRIYWAACWGAIVLLAVQISIDSTLRYITGSQPAPEPILANTFLAPFLVLHVIGSMTALLIGPLQFVAAIRTRWPRFHRTTGRIYVLGCAIGAPTGFVLAFGTSAGPLAGVPFAISAVLWPVFTWLGVRAILKARVEDHRNWMLRSYAVVAGALTLRLMLPAALMSGYEFYPAYQLISWLNWTTNLALVEYWIRRKRTSATANAAFVTA
ncbi:MAG TPA: DUF2306 domain-containing protein [Allosphingosinicella sp.]|nr:DUF2306 domain-containing protein [Allosphingosinicella sp.]